MDEIVVGIDVGTTKVCTLVGRVEEETIRILGSGVEPSEGIKKGVIVDLAAAGQAITHSVEKAEQAHLVTDKRLGPKPVPFGVINSRWETLKATMRPGDELWEFESPGESWEKLAGRAGLCIMREGQIIDAVITRMN